MIRYVVTVVLGLSVLATPVRHAYADVRPHAADHHTEELTR